MQGIKPDRQPNVKHGQKTSLATGITFFSVACAAKPAFGYVISQESALSS